MSTYNRLPEPVLQKYLSDPTGMDNVVRKLCHIPDDKYYCVGVWPDRVRGRVVAERCRTVRAVKISKSK